MPSRANASFRSNRKHDQRPWRYSDDSSTAVGHSLNHRVKTADRRRHDHSHFRTFHRPQRISLHIPQYTVSIRDRVFDKMQNIRQRTVWSYPRARQRAGQNDSNWPTTSKTQIKRTSTRRSPFLLGVNMEVFSMETSSSVKNSDVCTERNYIGAPGNEISFIPKEKACSSGAYRLNPSLWVRGRRRKRKRELTVTVWSRCCLDAIFNHDDRMARLV